MSRLPDRFREDRALRDAALAVLVADVEHARHTLSGKAVAARVAGTIGDGAKDVLEIAKIHADGHRGLIAGLIAILALWFARVPILEIFGITDPMVSEEPEPSDDSPKPEAMETENEPETLPAESHCDPSEPPSTGESHE